MPRAGAAGVGCFAEVDAEAGLGFGVVVDAECGRYAEGEGGEDEDEEDMGKYGHLGR